MWRAWRLHLGPLLGCELQCFAWLHPPAYTVPFSLPCCWLQVQLVRAGSGASAGDRSTFRLTASLGTLQVLLNYEGAGCATLSQVT